MFDPQDLLQPIDLVLLSGQYILLADSALSSFGKALPYWEHTTPSQYLIRNSFGKFRSLKDTILFVFCGGTRHMIWDVELWCA